MRALANRAALVGALATACGACAVIDAAGGGGDDDDGGGGTVTAGVFPNTVNPNLDLLFVVDNTGGMLDRQNLLAVAFPYIINALNAVPGGLPSLHFGVVSTDMGVGTNTGIQGCSTTGDAGTMHSLTCGTQFALQGTFVSDIRQTSGTRQKNYTGSLDAVMGCLVKLGQAGCAFEQPLASMRAALSPTTNPGFYRSDAALAVVLFSNEDDCSAESAFYSPTNTSVGPFTSFRCFQQGVTCDQPAAELGTHTNCRATEAPLSMIPLAQYTQFLSTLKDNPSKVSLTVIAGPTEPVDVVSDPNMPSDALLAGSCVTTAGPSVPAVRMVGLADQLARDGHATAFGSSCDNTFQAPLLAAAGAIKSSIGASRCLTGELRDTDTRMPGVQPRCTVSDGLTPTALTIPDCDHASARPCWRLIAEAPDCSYTPTHLALSVERDVPVTTGYDVINCDGI